MIPLNIKKITTSINIKTYLITFSYETRKGYYREQQRLISLLEKEDPKSKFKVWAKNCRTIFNAEILNIVELKELNKTIEI
ncbi:hypothetical protein [uncultured Clostridium sp.]|uniref:hypothetical protein n=1 Tax=uncultured Clostridium sp. TaxID=59620 RepID=UPI00272EFD26|nr:hypothetical protein [uncultured Clostridium sp.]